MNVTGLCVVKIASASLTESINYFTVNLTDVSAVAANTVFGNVIVFTQIKSTGDLVRLLQLERRRITLSRLVRSLELVTVLL